MNPDPELDLMLLYVAGVADADEADRAEALLSAASPSAAAAYAEALSVFHAVPLGIDPVRPPASVRNAVLGRIAADASTSAVRPAASSDEYVSRMRWPVYVASGLAACLAVALTLSVWNGMQMAERDRRLADAMAQLNDRNSQMASTLAGSAEVLRSPHVSLASMESKSDKAFGRVLYCPVTRQYQVTVFGLAPLPPGKGYELWLITPDQRKVAAGMFKLDDHGTATVIARPQQPVDVAALAAVTDEPAEGSSTPTGSIRLAGSLQASN